MTQRFDGSVGLGKTHRSSTMNNQPQTRGGFFTIAAWQRADDLTVKIYQTTQTFLPQERYGLNLPDATLAAYIRFLFIAKGSLTEVEYYIHLA